MSKSFLPYDAKHPMLLPKDSPVSILILRDIHERIGHMGKNSMLSELRQKFWIPQVFSCIKKICSKCVICRRYQARVGEQYMADLPQERLRPNEKPFSHVGIDYFGPFEVKRGRATVKRYGVIFTCLTIRAVHLEVAHSLDTDSCINAIRRSIARRGQVKTIISDNGTNLVGAEKELRQELQKCEQEQIHRKMLQKGINWKFNPPSASHFGGVWERLIRTTRKILYSLLCQQNVRMDDEALQTLFCEVEYILNSRPLLRMSTDVNDDVLTPNHLLIYQNAENIPQGKYSKDDLYAQRRWRQIQYLTDIFWKRWSKDYLHTLQERQKWYTKRRNMEVNDIVLIVDSSPRNCWALGKVMSVFCDRKGLVRSAKVKTQNNVLHRPIHKLCLILEAEM